jgi:hypothetical protein
MFIPDHDPWFRVPGPGSTAVRADYAYFRH